MNAPIPETYGSIGPWQRYVARERSARNMYLDVVQRAHHEYLTGPWPDREAYNHVEQSAWQTYHAAGREAWKIYTQEITPPPPPPARSPEYHPPQSASGAGWPFPPQLDPQATFNKFPESES